MALSDLTVTVSVIGVEPVARFLDRVDRIMGRAPYELQREFNMAMKDLQRSLDRPHLTADEANGGAG